MPRKRRKSYGLRERGGSTLRKRYARIMESLRVKHNCPNCGTKAVKRQSVGIWECRKCEYKFAGGAYQPETKVGRTSKRIRT
jgi:large subunit ribosomal protein L37Ae